MKPVKILSEVLSISKSYLNYYSICIEILYKINNLLFFPITRRPIRFSYSDVLENIINEWFANYRIELGLVFPQNGILYINFFYIYRKINIIKYY
jgi:transcriptional regulatory protein LevR